MAHLKSTPDLRQMMRDHATKWKVGASFHTSSVIAVLDDLDSLLDENTRLWRATKAWEAESLETKQFSASQHAALQAKSVCDGIEREAKAREEEREMCARRLEGIGFARAADAIRTWGEP